MVFPKGGRISEGRSVSKDQRGAIFTFMSFLMVLALLALVGAINLQRSGYKENHALESALNSASSKFDNLYSDIVSINKEAGAKAFDERNLPFSYSLDYNSIAIVQELPVKESVWNNYYDLLNAYGIFVNDMNSGLGEGFSLSVQASKNQVWGGNSKDTNFLILPQCMNYSIDSNLGIAGFYPAGSAECLGPFDPGQIKRYSVQVKVKQTASEDYNSITYSIPGLDNPAMPEFEFHFIDSNCASCIVADSNRNITGRFDPSQQNWIRIRCIGQSCKSQDVNLFFGNNLWASHYGSYRVDVNFSIAFKGYLDRFYFSDLNLAVRSNDFNLTYHNR